MELINRILSGYQKEGAVFFRRARALFLYNMMMICLLTVLIGVYAVANPAGFVRGASGAGIFIFLVSISTIALLKGHYHAAVNLYLIPTVILTISVRFFTAHANPDTAFTSYVFYWLYLIVFTSIFGKKQVVIPLSLLFIAGNIAIYLMVKPLLPPALMQMTVTGLVNSTIVLAVTGALCYINLIIYEYSSSIQINKVEENETQLKLIQEVFTGIQNIAGSLDSSSRRFTETAASLTDGTQSQAAILEESSASMAGIADAAKRVADEALHQAKSLGSVESGISELNTLILSVAERAKSVSSSSAEALKRGNEAADISSEALGRMKKIHESTEKIKEITNLISDIADKTNLLALNASIESARAGAAGRGFAVVADEISKLADSSTVSAKEISQLIKDTADNIDSGYEMFNRLNALIQGINETITQSHTGSSKNRETAARQSSLSDSILSEIRSVNELAQKIAKLMDEQHVATAELSTSFEGINKITQETAAASEEVSGATEIMAQDIEKLVAIVNRER